MSIIPKPQFPNVPQLPGVPQVLRSLQFPSTLPPGLGTAVALKALWSALTVKPQWGVYDKNGKLMVEPDTIRDFGHHMESGLANYPMQRGSFANYNKVASPFEVVLRMSKGSTLGARSAFIATLTAMQADLELYTILTPERSYFNCNILRVETNRRSVQGAYLLADVDVFFQEIREVNVSYSTSAAQDPSAHPVTAQGNVLSSAPPVSFDVATAPGVTP